jgi:dTMP kinase
VSPGALIVFEGAEGAGKSSQIRRLLGRLERAGVDVLAVREPGGTPVGDEVRRLLLDDPAREIEPRAEALLFMASRAQLVRREIVPALDSGRVVVADRFFLSTYAYQAAGRGLPESEIRAVNGFATSGLVPSLTLLLQVSPDVGLQRAGRRRGGHDRIESSGRAFHDRVAAAFARFATAEWQREHPECGPVVAVDAGGSEGAVSRRVDEALRLALPETFAALTGSDS